MLEGLKEKGLGQKLSMAEELNLSVEDFHKKYLSTNRPVILRGAAKDWPACGKWSLGFFAEHYPESKQFIIASSGEDIYKEKQEKKKLETASVKDIAEGKAYGNFSPLVSQHKALRDELKLGWLESLQHKMRSLMMYQLFMGAKGTHTDLHSEISTNLFIQLYGKKRWVLCSPKYTPVLDVPVTREPCFHSAFDGMKEESKRKSEFFPYIDYYEFELNPGDILLVPPYWWHQVKNEEEAVGLAVKWHNPVSFYKTSFTMTILTTFCVNPPLWKLVGKGSYMNLFTDGRD